ncbi:hypothetical protein [Protofrankia symbiont of Coriaria ruscifolia]|uniref:hypothetical protein n=1 Tax=Protofrankia symbiont of Coriaria ruscifolia TaxID=1306542 RepID=UPI0010412B06|nr:hypothetical protein [Protofrankia symbiont of Coriaria ruscifolia]
MAVHLDVDKHLRAVGAVNGHHDRNAVSSAGSSLRPSAAKALPAARITAACAGGQRAETTDGDHV